ncbi:MULTISPECIES: hypothetical protein [Enterobacteriaceae]|uniref:Uncharacterized protein n=1 Tax=Raoultella lignicola TaxID=3040939 RepID=A0ABU9F994_9ENTR|nr:MULTISPECIES: hypothetical protein [Enterobacteriaceae]MRT49354.1 hypothetical protein [Raoultella sp. RIT712]QNK07356.1 hypothetical protein HF679_21735 [Enterobacter sp. JUb54]ROS10636.1 hypothetical protein EDF82_3108 [Raoultella sp. BIGb0399]
MDFRKVMILALVAGWFSVSANASVFPASSGPVLACGADGGQHYQVDVTLFPKTLRVNGTFLELQSSTDANDGFKVGIYKQTGGLENAMLAVKAGFKPVLIEHNATYVCG